MASKTKAEKQTFETGPVDPGRKMELDDGTPVVRIRVDRSDDTVLVRVPEGTRLSREETDDWDNEVWYSLNTGIFIGEDEKTYKVLRNVRPGSTTPHDDSTPPVESLPDGNPKTAQGALKPPALSVIPSSALIQVGAVMALGKKKYGPFNWRDQPVTASTYIDAAMRHLMSWWDGETTDPESGASHLAHAAASLFVLIDALSTGNATDDRPKPGVAAELINLYRQNGGTFQRS